MDKTPYIGQLQYPITVEQPNVTKNATGEETVSGYTVVANLKAALNDYDTKEEVDGKLRNLIERSYTVRFRQEILDDADELVVRDNGNLYKIYHVREVKRKRFLEILVTSYE
jgi:head-tail adaptor